MFLGKILHFEKKSIKSIEIAHMMTVSVFTMCHSCNVSEVFVVWSQNKKVKKQISIALFH